MTAYLTTCLKYSEARENEYMLDLIDATASIVRDLTADSGTPATPLLAGDILRARAARFTDPGKMNKFLNENFVLATSAMQKADGQLGDVISSLKDDLEAHLPLNIQENDAVCVDYISRMSEADCRNALLTSIKSMRQQCRYAQMLENTEKMYKVQLNFYTREQANWATLAHGQAGEMDRHNNELKNTQKALLEMQKELQEKQKEATTFSEQVNMLAGRLEELACSQATKKNARMPVTSRLDKSLASLKQKLEFLEGSNVSQKDLEAREKEVAALKAENTKLLENVRDAHADRQRAMEDNESLREQLQKARAEKQADGSGKKKKNK